MPQPNPLLASARPFSLYAMRNLEGGADPKVASLAMQDLLMDYGSWFDDFQESTMAAAIWTAANTGAGSAAFAFNAQRGGAVQGATGGSGAGTTALKGPALYQSDDNPCFIVRVKFPAAVTNLEFEVGWANVISSQSAVSWSAVGTPAAANGLTDGGAVKIKTSDPTTTTRLLGVGTSTAAAGTTLVTALGGATGYTPTASKWVDFFVEARVGQMLCAVWDNGALVGNQKFSVASGPDTGVLLIPYVIFKELSAATKVFNIDLAGWTFERNQT